VSDVVCLLPELSMSNLGEAGTWGTMKARQGRPPVRVRTLEGVETQQDCRGPGRKDEHREVRRPAPEGSRPDLEDAPLQHPGPQLYFGRSLSVTDHVADPDIQLDGVHLGDDDSHVSETRQVVVRKA
jgi:hypothetical protein